MRRKVKKKKKTESKRRWREKVLGGPKEWLELVDD